MRLIGQTTIHPFFFYTGKLAGYIIWLVFVLSISNLVSIGRTQFNSLIVLSYALSGLALFLIIVSLINLGGSISLGVPSENTDFKNGGLYRFSRNPMYLGFNLLTVSAMIYTANIYVVVSGIYCLIIYHFIILGEESFLKQRFGERYLEYAKNVRRYF